MVTTNSLYTYLSWLLIINVWKIKIILIFLCRIRVTFHLYGNHFTYNTTFQVSRIIHIFHTSKQMRLLWNIILSFYLSYAIFYLRSFHFDEFKRIKKVFRLLCHTLYTDSWKVFQFIWDLSIVLDKGWECIYSVYAGRSNLGFLGSRHLAGNFMVGCFLSCIYSIRERHVPLSFVNPV